MNALSPAAPTPAWHASGWALALLAIVGPTLIAAHDPPSVTFYNQALAVLGQSVGEQVEAVPIAVASEDQVSTARAWCLRSSVAWAKGRA